MKKLLIPALLAATLTAMAAPVDPSAALQRAIGSKALKIKGDALRMKLIETRSVQRTPAIYLFSSSDGFLVLPADDNAPAILGYGDKAIPEGAQLPDNFLYFMDFLGSRVNRAARQEPVRVVRPDRSPIDALCKTQWNQSEPYNDKCPTVNGTRCVTGCVATCVSQVMKYHNWPAKGTGSLTYDWKREDGQTVEMTTDFSSYTFDWENMLNKYTSSNMTTANRNAVADLMRAVGGGVRMGYGTKSSGAVCVYIGDFLTRFMGYDTCMRYVFRDFYSLTDWEELIYDSLAEYGPVCYDGQSPAGGHSFVCDGYSKDGLFHINWGWGGLSDGFFLLDILDPHEQGIGGSDYDFSSDQGAVINIRPLKNGDPSPKTYEMWGKGGMAYSPYDQLLDSRTPDAIMVNGGFYNYGPYEFPAGFDIGYLYEPFYGGDNCISMSTAESLRLLYGWTSFGFYLDSDLQTGLYKLQIAVKGADQEEWNPVHVLHSEPQFAIVQAIRTETDRTSYVNATLKELKITMPRIVDLTYPTAMPYDEGATVTGALFNNGPVQLRTNMRVEILKDKKVVAYGITHKLTIDIETNREVTCNSGDWSYTDDAILENGHLQAGDYEIVLSVENGAGKGLWLPVTKPEALEVTVPSGIGAVYGEAAEASEAWYDLQGRRIDAGNLLPGIYIRRQGTRTEKIRIR